MPELCERSVWQYTKARDIDSILSDYFDYQGPDKDCWWSTYPVWNQKPPPEWPLQLAFPSAHHADSGSDEITRIPDDADAALFALNRIRVAQRGPHGLHLSQERLQRTLVAAAGCWIQRRGVAVVQVALEGYLLDLLGSSCLVGVYDQSGVVTGTDIALVASIQQAQSTEHPSDDLPVYIQNNATAKLISGYEVNDGGRKEKGKRSRGSPRSSRLDRVMTSELANAVFGDDDEMDDDGRRSTVNTQQTLIALIQDAALKYAAVLRDQSTSQEELARLKAEMGAFGPETSALRPDSESLLAALKAEMGSGKAFDNTRSSSAYNTSKSVENNAQALDSEGLYLGLPICMGGYMPCTYMHGGVYAYGPS